MSKSTRRDFLKRSALGAATVGLTPYLFTSAQPVRAEATSDRLRMGCIGVGDKIGRAHV